MYSNVGLIREDEMIICLNQRRYCDLSNNLQHFMQELFGLIPEDSFIQCERIMGFIKPDFKITCNGISHNVSMKSGSSIIMHQENITKFISWLKEQGISDSTIETILLYQFGDGTTDGTGEKRYGYADVHYLYKDRIKEANIELNSNKDFVKKVIRRCVFKGTNEAYEEADFLYHGDVNYGVCINQKQTYKHIDVKSWGFINNLHIGPLHLRPHARYVDKETTSYENRAKIEMYWPYLVEDMQYIARRYNS